jgi:MFS family permease
VTTCSAEPDAGADLQPRQRRLSLAAVLASTVGLGLAYGIGYTITTVQLAAWGADGWLVGLGGSAPSLAVLALVPFAPRIAARMGPVRAMVAGSVVMAVTFALMPVLNGSWWWVLLRLLSGIGLILPWLVGETWINTVSADATRGRVLAVYTLLLFGGWAAGPLLLDAFGTTGALPFVLGIAGMVLLAAPLVAARRLAPTLQSPGRFRFREVIALAPLALAASATGGVVEFGYISLLPVYAVEAGASDSTALRLLSVLLVGGIVLQFGIGWLADHVDRTALLAALGVALAALAALLAVLITVDGLAFAAAFVLGGVVMAFYAVGLALLGQHVPRQRLVLANAGFLMAYETGAVVGPLLGGIAIDDWPPHGIVLVTATAGLALAAYAWSARAA